MKSVRHFPAPTRIDDGVLHSNLNASSTRLELLFEPYKGKTSISYFEIKVAFERPKPPLAEAFSQIVIANISDAVVNLSTMDLGIQALVRNKCIFREDWADTQFRFSRFCTGYKPAGVSPEFAWRGQCAGPDVVGQFCFLLPCTS